MDRQVLVLSAVSLCNFQPLCDRINMSVWPEPSAPRLDDIIELRRFGSTHIGGRSASLSGLPARQITYSPGGPAVSLDPNGEFEVGQMYAQYAQLRQPRACHPVLFMHGGGLSGVCWETKPDGQSGWQDFFLRAGHDVWLADAVERGRASWARSPEFFKGEAFFRSKQQAWELFRIGLPGSWHSDAKRRQHHAHTRFPVAAFDTFMKQSMPRWTTNDAATQAAYDELVLLHGPFVLIAHSQACHFAFHMALAQPEKVRAIVALEPSGLALVPDEQLARLQGIPHLFIWGDNVPTHPLWRQLQSSLKDFQNRLQAQGVSVDEWDLPALGEHGNSHMLMMDSNSYKLASHIHHWLGHLGLMKN